jgi:hypothetical protein
VLCTTFPLETREPDQASTSLRTRETRSETARRRVGVAAHPGRRRTRLVGDSTPAVHIAVQRRVLRVRLVAEHLVDVDLGPIGRAGVATPSSGRDTPNRAKTHSMRPFRPGRGSGPRGTRDETRCTGRCCSGRLSRRSPSCARRRASSAGAEARSRRDVVRPWIGFVPALLPLRVSSVLNWSLQVSL